MKVFFYIPSLKSGGAEKQCALMAFALKEQYGYDVEIILTHPSDPQNANKKNWEMVVSAGIPVHVLQWYHFRDLYAMCRLFRKNRDAYLFCYMTFPVFWGGLVALIAGMKNVYGGVRTSLLPWRFMLMEKFAHRFLSRATIFNSYKARELFVAQRFDKDRSIVISNAIEPTQYTRDHDANDGSIRIITVGTFWEAKDYHTWIAVINEVRAKTTKKIRAIIIGYGELEDAINNWIKDFGLQNIIEILPGNHGVGIPEELAKSDIYLSTSVFEGTSNSLMEAMRAGLPVVATDVGDNGYLVENGKVGFICKPKDVEGLSSAVLQLVADINMRKTFGAEGMKIMHDRHSIRRIADQYAELIRSKV